MAAKSAQFLFIIIFNVKNVEIDHQYWNSKTDKVTYNQNKITRFADCFFFFRESKFSILKRLYNNQNKITS